MTNVQPTHRKHPPMSHSQTANPAGDPLLPPAAEATGKDDFTGKDQRPPVLNSGRPDMLATMLEIIISTLEAFSTSSGQSSYVANDVKSARWAFCFRSQLKFPHIYIPLTHAESQRRLPSLLLWIVEPRLQQGAESQSYLNGEQSLLQVVNERLVLRGGEAGQRSQDDERPHFPAFSALAWSRERECVVQPADPQRWAGMFYLAVWEGPNTAAAHGGKRGLKLPPNLSPDSLKPCKTRSNQMSGCT